MPRRDVPRFIAHHRGGQLPVEQLLTHPMSLDDTNEGFDCLTWHEATRHVVFF